MLKSLFLKKAGKKNKNQGKAKFSTVKAGKILFGFVGFIVIGIVIYTFAYYGKIYPGVFVAGHYVSGLKLTGAEEFLAGQVAAPEKIQVQVESYEAGETKSFEIDLKAVDFSYDFNQSARAAYNLDRTGNVWYDFYVRLKAPFRKSNLGLRIKLDEEKLNENISAIAGQVGSEPVEPSVKVVGGNVVFEDGKPGVLLDPERFRLEIGQYLAFAKTGPINVSLKIIDPTLSEEEKEIFISRAETLLPKTINLSHEFLTFSYKGVSLFDFLDPSGGYKKDEVAKLAENFSKEVNRSPQNPVFVFEGGKVQEFAPAKDGIKLVNEKFENEFLSALTSLEETEEVTVSVSIPVTKTAPTITTGQVNNLGINELIGRGSSRFAGSIAARVHNIALSASKFQGVLLAPGEVLSFNDTLGDVSAFTGYQQAYVIKDGRTVLGDGGGVCQVSTTLFRAALDAGLPIVERRAHSYRVSYYEQDSPPGLDATVYAPTTDLKIKNDTPAHILIQTYVDRAKATLVYEIYGTSDGRVAKTSKPIVTNVTPPPEDLYVDDPTLPEGTIRQIDFKAWGARVSFDYTVERDGEIIYQKTFISNFRPWQAVFLRGTGPAN